MKTWTAVLALPFVALVGCALFDEPQPVHPDPDLDVVSADGPFDPSEAVEDDDAREPTDPTSAAAAEASASPTDDTDRPAGIAGEAAREDVTTAQEVKRLERRRDALVDRGTRPATHDDAVKRDVAHNPPPEDPGAAESLRASALDLFLEGVILLMIAVPLTALVCLWRRYPWPLTAFVGGVLTTWAALSA